MTDPSNNEDPESTPSPSPTPTPTPTEDPFAGENGDQKQRREDLIHQNDEHNRDQREQDDKGAVATLTVPGDLRIRVSLWL